MEAKKHVMSREGVKELEDELNDLIVNKRNEIAEKLKEARAQGDLSENAEYDAAKDEQRDVEARIEQIEEILKNVEIYDDAKKTDKVSMGSKVKILDVELNEELEYRIVGSQEANILKGKISNESPIGRALIGAKVGQVVSVETESGTFDYKVVSINKK
jgi:transcription elongation factor GreA